MSLISTVKDIMSEKATDFVINKFIELLDDKDLKDKFKTASQKYFVEIFENCDLSDEFDFEAVETYLLDNLDNKIISIFHDIKNIGHEGRDSIREDILRRAVARGNGNEKAIRKYCNSIIDFVGACLHDKISDNDKILASEITSITNEHYKRLINEIGDIKNIELKILNQMEYLGSFAEQIDNIGLPEITNNRFSYANSNIGFYGRNIEQEEIEKFMLDNRLLLFWFIIGRGGVGKSKFALHICKKYKQENWKAVWLNKDAVECINRVTRNNGYNKPLLLICDYAGEYIEIIKTLLLKLSYNSQCKIRVLLLERSGYSAGLNNNFIANSYIWYNRLFLGHNRDIIKNIEYNSNALNLDYYTLNDEDMFSILDDFSGKNLSETIKKDIVDFVKNRLSSVSDKNHASHSEERCLFLLFTADAYMNGNYYKNWDTEALIEQYIIRFMDNLNAHFDENICKYAYAILAIASAIGTINIENVNSPSIFEYYVVPIKDGLNYNVDINNLKTFLSALCEKNIVDFNVNPMCPDLVGEFFWVNIFDSISTEHKREWYRVFFSPKYQDYFCSFLMRCLDDWRSLKLFKNIIKELLEFAVENNCFKFINECVNNLFFVGLSYCYELSEKDLLWLKNVLLINKNERWYFEYFMILFNTSSKTSDVSYILHIADIIKKEILSVYNTIETAVPYAKLLVRASSKTNNTNEIIAIAKKIKDEILIVYNTAEVAEQYANALVNASKMSGGNDAFTISERIKYEILSVYNTVEIAKTYTMALVNASFGMHNVNERLAIADIIKNEVLSVYSVTEIAEQYAMVFVNISAGMLDVNDRLHIAYRVKNEILSVYNTDKIAKEYAKILFNALNKMPNANDRLAIAKKINNELLSVYNTVDIAEVYIETLVNTSIKMSSVNDRLHVADKIKEILKKFNTKNIAEYYIMVLNYIYKNYPEHEYLLEEIKTVQHEYNLLSDNK